MGLETAAIIGIATAVATTASSVVPALISKPQTPKAPTLVTDTSGQEKQIGAAEDKQRQAAALAAGKSSTILTSPLGETADNSQNSATLLGT